MQNASDLVDFARDVGELANAAGELALSVPGIRTAYKAGCRIFAGTPGGELLGQLDIKNICTPYLAEDGRTFGEVGPPPFQGGQCDVVYDLFANATVRTDGNVVANNTLNGSGLGPISFEVVDIPQTGGRTRIEGRYVGQDGVIAQYVIRSTQPLAGGGERVTETEISNFSLTRQDGQPDDCGDPDGVFEPGDGYDGEDFGDPQTITGPDGRDYEITVDEPEVDDDGNITIPVTIDGVDFNLGPGGGDNNLSPTAPNYDLPSDNNEPGPGGGADGEDNPPDGIVVMRPVAAVTVTISVEPPNASREVGGPENVFIPGSLFDAGWFRWIVGGASTTPQRIVGRRQQFIFSPGICDFADGYEIKFSRGFSGFSNDYVCTQEGQ